MTTADCTASTTQHKALHTALVVPDLAANVAATQHAGDLAYAFAKLAGVPLPERAIAFHVAFAETMRELGSPLPGPCDLCTGGESVEKKLTVAITGPGSATPTLYY